MQRSSRAAVAAPALPAGYAALRRTHSIVTHLSVAALVYLFSRTSPQYNTNDSRSVSPSLLRAEAPEPQPCPPPLSCPRHLEREAPAVAAPSAAAAPPTAAANAAAPPAASAPPPPPPNPWRTRQTCFQQPDDSELCTYDGPICFRGLGEGVALLSDVLEGSALASADSRPYCADSRDALAADSCNYGPHGKRRAWAPPPATLEEARDAYWALPSLPTLGLPFSYPASIVHEPAVRRWGPTLSGINVGHVPPGWVANLTSADDLAALGPRWAAAVAGARGPPPPGLAALHAQFRAEHLIRMPERVTWLAHSALWLAHLTHDSFSHPYHASIALGQLWGIKRANASVHDTRAAAQRLGAAQAPQYDWTPGATASGGHFPPLDVLLLHSTHEARHNATSLPPWTAALLRLLSQAHTRFLLPADYTHGPPGVRANATHWLCAPRGVILGQRDRVFAGSGDAHAFRLAAYAAAGVGAPAWPTHPPRTILLIVRERWRQFTNLPDVIQLLNATGLPLRVERALGALSFSVQVALMAGTGILVAAHGAALMNAVFMPKGSVVIEVSPHLGVTPLYGRICDVARVRHLNVYSDMPSNASLHSGMEGMEEYYGGARFAAECTRAHLSSTDAPLEGYCNLATKRAQIEVSLDGLRGALRTALDDIGCKDSYCRKPSSAEVVDMLRREPPSR